MAGYQIKAMTKKSITNAFLALALFVLSGQVFAQELSAGFGNVTGTETGNETKIQKLNTSLTIDGLGTSNDYPVCHRMKNGVVKHRIQTATTQAATTQTAIIE